MLSAVNRHVIARESNIVRVDFSREPDPPTPCFPGANGLRAGDCVHDLGPAFVAPSPLVNQKIRLKSLERRVGITKYPPSPAIFIDGLGCRLCQQGEASVLASLEIGLPAL